MGFQKLTPIPRPKILSVITVPTGGWVMTYSYKNGGGYVQDTYTIAAGDYFMAWDQSDDDFLYAFSKGLNDALAAVPLANAEVCCWIDSDHKVNIGLDGDHFQGGNADFKLEWTATDGDDIGDVLGFGTGSDSETTSTDNDTFTGAFHHGYGWYSDQDGQLANDTEYDIDVANAYQTVSVSGHVKTHYVGGRKIKNVTLRWLPNYKVFSGLYLAGGEVSYGDFGNFPSARNEPLDLWWYEARQGKRFRYYRDGQAASSKATRQGVPTGSAATVMTDSGGVRDGNNHWVKGQILWDTWNTSNIVCPQKFLITASSVTTITLDNASPDGYSCGTVNSYYLMDQPYDEYVLDLNEMDRFEPIEMQTGKPDYEINLPLIRYKA